MSSGLASRRLARQPIPGVTPSHLPSLTGLRWLAAFLVFGFHIGTLGIISNPRHAHAWNHVFSQGASGVAFFFILSGFVLTWTALSGGDRAKDPALSFWRRRFARVYPNHFVVWAAVVIMMLLWGDPIGRRVATENLFLVQGWFKSDGLTDYTPSWSLGCEMFFYLCFPFVLPILRRAKTWALYGLLAGALVLMYCLIQWTRHLDFATSWWLVQRFAPVRVLEFLMGISTALLVLRGRWFGPGMWISTAVAAVILYENFTWSADYWTVDVAVAWVWLVGAVAKADIAGRWSPWSNRVMVRLGEISFAFYLVHIPFMRNVLRLMRVHGVVLDGAANAALVAGFFAGSLLLAWLLFRFVETPMNKRLRPKPRRPKRAKPEATAESPSKPRVQLYELT